MGNRDRARGEPAFTPTSSSVKFSFIASASATEPLVKVFGTETVRAFTPQVSSDVFELHERDFAV
jgi:hypothetical protein